MAAPPEDTQPLHDALDGLLALTRTVLPVDLRVAEGAAAAIDSAPSTRRVVVDVVAEALTNALRHGAARRAKIAITQDGDCVTVTVTDDGTWRAPEAPGAGTGLFETISPSWSLGPAPDGGTRLEVALPCAPPLSS